MYIQYWVLVHLASQVSINLGRRSAEGPWQGWGADQTLTVVVKPRGPQAVNAQWFWWHLLLSHASDRPFCVHVKSTSHFTSRRWMYLLLFSDSFFLSLSPPLALLALCTFLPPLVTARFNNLPWLQHPSSDSLSSPPVRALLFDRHPFQAMSSPLNPSVHNTEVDAAALEREKVTFWSVS